MKSLYWRARRPVFETFGSDRYSHLAAFDLDRQLKQYLDFDNGFFIEVGGNDGLEQSNTYWFERFRGWRGLLVEALPEKARLCAKNRRHSQVVNAALVADTGTKSIKIKSANLMAYIPGQRTAEEDAVHLANAIAVQKLTEVPEIEVPATTLATLLDARGGGPADFFSLDVEGYEVPVLRGMDPERHRPRLILVETKHPQRVLAALNGHYRQIDQLSFHDYLLETDNPL
ncbi:MAG: FkbM family methyltransferase [Alphaproteobacteria bacterium]|nr:FkbM family methyltransferase [Alphaproteobacteria bacterium]